MLYFEFVYFTRIPYEYFVRNYQKFVHASMGTKCQVVHITFEQTTFTSELLCHKCCLLIAR